MKSLTFLSLVLLSLLFAGCRKEKTRSYAAQLLLSKKFPTPLANRKIDVYQSGSGSGAILPVGASSSSASAVTDPNGYFRMRFTLGKGIFFAIPTTNNNPLVLRTSYEDTSYPGFSRANFPDSIFYPSAGPIFIGKTIDTVIFKVSLLSDLASTDTVGLRVGTVTGRFNKDYTGRSGSAGSQIVLDTITKVLFTDFDYATYTYKNSIYGGRKYMTSVGYVTITASQYPLPIDFPEPDEGRREVTIFFNK